jgi:hypothetical protein
MKTLNIYSLLLSTMILLFGSVALTAQFLELEMDSDVTSPHINLIETTDNDFSRIFFRNAGDLSKRWALSGRLGTSNSSADFGLYYNGSSRWLFNEADKLFKLTSVNQEIDFNSGSAGPHLLLNEQSTSDYARITFKNEAAGVWDIAARGGSDDRFNIYYNNEEAGADKIAENLLTIDGDNNLTEIRTEVQIEEELEVEKLATLEDLSVIQQASFSRGLISSDPIRLRETGNGPAGPSLEFMSDNSTITVGASIKLTNATGGGNNRNLIIDNRSVVGDIVFQLDGADTHMRMSNGNIFSYKDLQPWVSNNTDLGSLGRVWDNMYVNHILSNVAFGEEDTNGDAVIQINERLTDPYSLAFKNNGSGNDVWYVKSGVNSLEWWYDADGESSSGSTPIYRGKIDAAGGGFLTSSDVRLKKSISSLESTLSKVKKLNPTSYHYIDQTDNDRRKIGFIAQELENIFPETVSKPQNETEFYSVNYDAFSVIAIKAIQEQQDIIEKQEAKIQHVETTISSLQKEMAKIKALMQNKK